MTDPLDQGRPLQVDGLPDEEGVETAQAAEDLEKSPEEKKNATDPEKDDAS